MQLSPDQGKRDNHTKTKQWRHRLQCNLPYLVNDTAEAQQHLCDWKGQRPKGAIIRLSLKICSLLSTCLSILQTSLFFSFFLGVSTCLGGAGKELWREEWLGGGGGGTGSRSQTESNYTGRKSNSQKTLARGKTCKATQVPKFKCTHIPGHFQTGV